MNTELYEKVDGKTALVKLLEGERIYDNANAYWFVEGDAVKCNDSCETYESTIPVRSFLSKTNTWYVKKPFDVRAEMLARPNEWVGAYKDEQGNWCKVKFNSKAMTAQDTVMTFKATVFRTEESELDLCIPIEDVPKEEL